VPSVASHDLLSGLFADNFIQALAIKRGAFATYDNAFV